MTEIASAVQHHARRVGTWLAVALGFSLTVSTALDNLLLGLLLIAWVAGGHLRGGWREIARNRVLSLALALYAAMLVSTLWAQAPWDDIRHQLGKYLDLLFVPVFAAFLAERQARRAALLAFVAGMLLNTAVSDVASLGLLQDFAWLEREAEYPVGFRSSITHSVLGAYAALVLALLTQEEQRPRWRAAWLALALALVHNVVFVMIGRTGYLVLGVLALYLFAATYGRRGLAAAILGLALLFGAAYAGSGVFRERIDRAVLEYTHPQEHADRSSSVGQRLEWYRNTAAIVAQHPIFGVGVGGFTRAYASHVADSGMRPTIDPHNEYLLIATQVGVAGLLLFLWLLYSQWSVAARLGSALDARLARGLVLTMSIGCLFNSLLTDHAEGLFFAWLTGALFARVAPRPPARGDAR